MVSSAALAAELFPRSLIVVGATAEYPEVEYGWLEPEPAALHSEAGMLSRVSRFWEKPAVPQAEALWHSGCLWNTFVTIGTADTFLELVCSEVRMSFFR
jgi:mannose-1-phosphate guanylyltransferase